MSVFGIGKSLNYYMDNIYKDIREKKCFNFISKMETWKYEKQSSISTSLQDMNIL